MRIAILGPFFFPQIDGVEKVMLNHARHLARRGHEVHVLTSRLRFPKGDFPDVPDREEMDGFQVHRLPVRIANAHWRFSYLNNGGLLIDGLVATLRRISPDVLHAHQIAAPAWAFGAAWYALTRRRKFFYSPHYHADSQPGRRFYYSLVRGLNLLPLRIADRVFHLTAADHEPFLREFPHARADRLDVLPNGMDPPLRIERPQRAPGEFNLLFVGRVDEHRKGFDLLQAAFEQLRQPGWCLHVVGRIADTTRASLKARFGQAVRVYGLVDEPTLHHAYAAADLFVMPSRYEGFGIPYIEAMRYEVAVIGTYIGGIPEVVVPGTGRLVPVDDLPALSAAINELAAAPQERARLAAAGRAWSAKFHWESIIDQLEAAYAT